MQTLREAIFQNFSREQYRVLQFESLHSYYSIFEQRSQIFASRNNDFLESCGSGGEAVALVASSKEIEIVFGFASEAGRFVGPPAAEAIFPEFRFGPR